MFRSASWWIYVINSMIFHYPVTSNLWLHGGVINLV